jgi:hypothetical protein
MPIKKYKTEAERKAAHRESARASYKRNYWENRERRKARDKEFQDKKFRYKIGLECWNPDCNFKGADDPKKLEFHHMNPDHKRFSPFKATSWDAFMAEVKKCVPLCKDCHVAIESHKAETAKAKRLAEIETTDPVPF